jgi:1,4-alpha-glucan branching enzyme
MLKKEYLKSRAVCKVTFTLPEAIHAETVHLVGDFNAWSETATPLRKFKDGRFSVALDLEKERAYQFRYLVNAEEWHNDWNADQYQTNPFSGDNSIVMT